MIGFILPDITNPFFPEVLAGFDQEIRKKGYTYFLCDTVSANGDTDAQYERESQYLNVLSEKQVDGIIMMGGRVDLAKPDPTFVTEVTEVGKRMPVVLVNGSLPGSKLHRVAADERRGAALAARHLLELGHSAIAVIGGFSKMSNTRQRTSGFLQVLEEHGLKPRKSWIMHEGFSVNDGAAMMRRLLQSDEMPTAVFCLNDLVAIGAMKTAARAGLRIPQDLSIIGYDDIPFASYSVPELTTVSLRANELGRLSAEMLHKLMTKTKTPRTVTVEPELIVRETTAKPSR